MMVRSMPRAVLFTCLMSVACGMPSVESEEQASKPVIQLKGLTYEYFEGDWNSLPDFDKLTPKAKGDAADNLVDIGIRRRTEHFGFRFRGDLVINQEGVYTFFMDSDDGSRLKVDGKVIINHDGLHGVGVVKKGMTTLKRGTVAFEVVVFEKTGDEALLLWASLRRKALTPLSRSSRNLLHYAIEHNEYEFVKQLLASKFDVNGTNSTGQTPLHLAAQLRMSAITKLLIAAGADIYAQSGGNGQTPLGIALQPNYWGQANPALAPILAAVKNPNIKVGGGEYPVHIAAQYDLPKVLEALAKKNANLSIKNDRGKTPVEVAMSHNKLKAFGYLFPLIEDVSGISTDDGQGILHWANERRLGGAVASLLKRGMDVDAKNDTGETPLFIATWNGDIEMVRLLLKAGANPNTPDQSGMSALSAAAWNNHTAIIRLLVSSGAKFQSRGNTPLHAAAWQGHIFSVRALLKLKAPINVQDSDGSTPLHKAAWRGHTAVVEALLARDADRSIRDASGFTAADKARDAGKRAKAVAALLAGGK